MNRILSILFLLIAVAFLAGCTSPGNYAPAPAVPVTAAATAASVGTTDFSTVAMADLLMFSKSWDADAEDDGLVAYIGLKDAQENPVKFVSDTPLPFTLEIWSVDAMNGKNTKLQNYYTGKGTISNWQEGNLLLSTGIRIPYEDIKKVSAAEKYQIYYGYVTITTPNGKSFEAKCPVVLPGP